MGQLWEMIPLSWPFSLCPRQGTTQKDGGSEIGALIGRLVIKGNFEPVGGVR
jgi:hypothetical protein